MLLRTRTYIIGTGDCVVSIVTVNGAICCRENDFKRYSDIIHQRNILIMTKLFIVPTEDWIGICFFLSRLAAV